jgi:ABC-type phosphate transport system substrate-binding protein
MKAKKTKLTAATLGAFLAFGGLTLANAAGNTPNSNSSKRPGKYRKHHHHHKGGKKSKKGSGSTTPPPK